MNTTVVFTPLLSWLLLGERPKVSTWPIVATAACGILFMSHGLTEPRWGDGLCLLSALGYSVWILSVARVSRVMERPFMLAASQFALTGVIGMAVGLACEDTSWVRLAGAAPELLVLGVLSTGTAFTLQAVAQRSTTATEAAVIMSAESVFGAIAAATILRETMSLPDVLGATLILAAILLIQLVGSSSPVNRVVVAIALARPLTGPGP